MKNLPFLLLLVAFTFTSCGCHYYGLKSGLNVSTINGDNSSDYQPRFGLMAGGFAELCVGDYASVQPEIQYSQQGAKYTDINGYDGTIKLDYINVPVMGKFKVSKSFIVEAGPQMGFLLSAKDKFKSSIDSGTTDIKDSINNLDFGANLGLDYDQQNGWLFGVRYNLGLSNIYKNSDTNNKNGILQLSIAFKFQ